MSPHTQAGPELADEDRERLTVLDSLTGIPRCGNVSGASGTDAGGMPGGDLLLYAIPVCGPYQALQNYKYKLKLTPGRFNRFVLLLP